MKTITDIHCSQLSRPMKCAGSLRFEGLDQPETGQAAKEGTAAGEYLQCLLERKTTTMPSHAQNGIEFTDDMKFYTNEIAKEILNPIGAGSLVLCETKIDWQTRSGIWIKGQYDASFVRDGKLYIDDLKYGWNLVEVKENWQLLGYAIGEVIRRGTAFDRIVLRIHQPRPHHEDGPTRAWEITHDELIEYKEKIERRMAQIAGGFAELVTGSQCKYCIGTDSPCPAFNRSVFHSVEYVLSDFKQDSITEQEISKQLDLLDRVTEILKIKSDSIKQLAVSKIKNGAIIPGYMVDDSLGDRKWKKSISPEVIEVLCGKKIVETVMLSPAKAEKLGVPKDLVKGFTERFFLGQKLVRKDLNKLGNNIFGKRE